jgi:hypothetical protein
MEIIKLKISEEFSKTPGPRFRKEGAFSGQEFLEDILIKKFDEAIESKKILEIDLDGTYGYGTSFLEQVFGGLARKYSIDIATDYLKFISEEEPYLIDDIKEYMKVAVDIKKENYDNE